MAEMQRGVVKWFNDAKGFGFIQHETGKDVFVHYSVIESEGFKTLKDGEEVTYELREGDKGLNASRVMRMNPPIIKQSSAAKKPQHRTAASMIEIEKISESDDLLDTGSILGSESEDELSDIK